MYTTISLKRYRQAIAALRNHGNADEQVQAVLPPPEGPHSAYLVFQDDENEEDNYTKDTRCWGCCDENRVRELPFPQDKCLTVEFSRNSGQNSHTDMDRVYFIPLPGQPISSNCYYVVRAEGRHKGLVEICSKEEDMRMICYRRSIKDIRPRSLEVDSPYQHIQVIQKKSRFTTKSIVSDGFPPEFLRKKDWEITAKELRGNHGRLPHVQGLNDNLRSQLPSLGFPILEKRSGIVRVGEWYCPFIFIKEMGGLEDPKRQLMESPFYKMELEKFWEEIYSIDGGGEGDIIVEKTVRVEEGLLLGREVVEKIREDDGSVWMKALNGREELKGVRLSRPIIEKIRADQGRAGESVDEVLSVNRSFTSIGKERKFACYVVVERYVLRRMEGSVVLTYSFRNCSHIQGKWE
eukprot:Gb_22145 [translate_table: standard]